MQLSMRYQHFPYLLMVIVDRAQSECLTGGSAGFLLSLWLYVYEGYTILVRRSCTPHNKLQGNKVRACLSVSLFLLNFSFTRSCNVFHCRCFFPLLYPPSPHCNYYDYLLAASRASHRIRKSDKVRKGYYLCAPIYGYFTDFSIYCQYTQNCI